MALSQEHGYGIRWTQDNTKSNSAVYCGWDMGKLLSFIVQWDEYQPCKIVLRIKTAGGCSANAAHAGLLRNVFVFKKSSRS